LNCTYKVHFHGFPETP